MSTHQLLWARQSEYITGLVAERCSAANKRNKTFVKKKHLLKITGGKFAQGWVSLYVILSRATLPPDKPENWIQRGYFQTFEKSF